MNNWFMHLKNALNQTLPDDHISANKEYGRIRYHLKYIYPSVFKYWKIGSVAFLLVILGAILSFPMPMIFRYLVDNVIMNRRLHLLFPVLALLVLVSVFSQLVNKLQTFYNTRFDQKVMLDIQQRLLDRVFSLPKIFFDRIHRGYLMSRLTSDVNGIKWFFSGPLVQMIVQGIRFFGGIIFLFYLEWRIAVPVVLSLPLPFFVTKFLAVKNYN